MLPALVPIAYSLLGHGLGEFVESRDREKSRRGGDMRTGSLTCPGLDDDAWESTCRTPLYANAWNYWKLIRSTYDGVSKDEIANKAAWFLQNAVQQRIKGKIRQVKIQVEKLDNPWGTPVKTSIRDCPQGELASLKPSEFAPLFYTVNVAFVYRGAESDMAWPSMKQAGRIAGTASAIVGNYNCPVEAAWILDTIYEPSYKDVPPASDDSWLNPGYDNELKDLGLPNINTPTIQFAIVGTSLVIGAIAVGYFVRSFR